MISISFEDSTKILEIPDGQVVGLFGKNGSGKTTLLKKIHDSNMVYITDGQSLFDEMTALDHKKFFSHFYDKFNAERFDKLMELFELEKDNLVKNYSKGQRSKLELAIGFCIGSKYILMDEPFLGNDPFMRSDFLKIMAGLLEDDSILIIATHYLEEIENFIDRAVFMNYHKIVKDITMEELIDNGSNLLDTAREVFGVDDNRVMSIFLEEN